LHEPVIKTIFMAETYNEQCLCNCSSAGTCPISLVDAIPIRVEIWEYTEHDWHWPLLSNSPQNLIFIPCNYPVVSDLTK
jgi:hypothetical protein